MAEKRMFTGKIVNSDFFKDMPISAQALYFHLGMNADDEGFLNNARSVQRSIGATDEDRQILIDKNFIIVFDSGIVAIKHWKMHNTIQASRLKETQYTEERSMLKVKENQSYTLDTQPNDNTETDCQQNDNNLSADCQQNDNTCCQNVAEIRLDKIRLDKSSIEECNICDSNESQPTHEPSQCDSDKSTHTTNTKKTKKKNNNTKETIHDMFNRLLPDYSISDNLKSKIIEWLIYKQERKDTYQEQGMKSLLRQLETNATQYGDKAVCEVIDESMSNNWKGIIFDRLKQRKEIVPDWMQKKKSKSFNNDSQRKYDFNSLEKELLDTKKTVDNDPELAARAETLKRVLGGV